ncbi:MAG TPA: hypothetical protein VGV13_02425, partial [Methylomirabilota bacterium]|nr:hypothetical protein [Methylomirabilota bacterium]
SAKILDVQARTGNSHFVGVFSYAGMPYDEAERSMRLFAREVMPALQKVSAPPPAPVLPDPAARIGVGLLGS